MVCGMLQPARAGRPTAVPRVTGPIRWPGPVEVRDVEFLRANTDRRIKITLPGPFTMAQQVVVRARVSRSGQAQAQADDWGAEAASVKPGTQGVHLVIQKRLGP